MHGMYTMVCTPWYVHHGTLYWNNLLEWYKPGLERKLYILFFHSCTGCPELSHTDVLHQPSLCWSHSWYSTLPITACTVHLVTVAWSKYVTLSMSHLRLCMYSMCQTYECYYSACYNMLLYAQHTMQNSGDLVEAFTVPR